MHIDIDDILKSFAPISLEEMDAVKLMNRIDTKFAVSLDQIPQILRLAQSEYYIQEIDNKRIFTYNTMYYDTKDLEMYTRHHDRRLVRQKIRVRQYVESDLNFLEVKRKNNKGRTKKKRIGLPIMDISNPTTDVKDFIAAKSEYEWVNLKPCLRTLFNRITLVNKQKTERLTIDLNLIWENQDTKLRRTFSNLVIIELKRDGNAPSPMVAIMQSIRIRPLKISKYCIGTALTNPNVKANRFKEKIKRIEKLTKQTASLQ